MARARAGAAAASLGQDVFDSFFLSHCQPFRKLSIKGNDKVPLLVWIAIHWHAFTLDDFLVARPTKWWTGIKREERTTNSHTDPSTLYTLVNILSSKVDLNIPVSAMDT